MTQQSNRFNNWDKHPCRAHTHWAALLFASMGLVLTTTAVDSFPRPVDLDLNHFQNHEAMAVPVTVASDRVNIGSEYIPRRTDLTNNLIVRSGQTVDLPSNGTYDYIEVAGTLRVPRSQDTILRFTTMIILPGGYFDAGTTSEPIPCNHTLAILVRDIPIDTNKDPFQWGNGLVNFGRQMRVGCSKTNFVETTGGLSQGSSNISLASTPTNWQVGDEVVIPDTLQVPVPNGRLQGIPRRESRITISSVSGNSVTLSKGLDFAHPDITDPNGVLILHPRIANLTRNITIRSENPKGSRGHTADIGKGSTWDIRHNQFSGLGRTQNIALEDTALSKAHIGTNQRGKYTEHHHHSGSVVGSSDIGNVYIGQGAPASKWGLVVHGTSDALVQDNIALDFPGAGFVTEDGYEVRNVFRHNFAMGSIGNGQLDASGNVFQECPGCEGAGFWFRGVMNRIEGNEGWNNGRSGITLFNQQQPAGMYPSVPGGTPDKVIDPFVVVPVSMISNVAAVNSQVGIEHWGTNRFPQENTISAYNGSGQVMAFISNKIHLWLKNPKLICQYGVNTSSIFGIHASNGYVSGVQLDGGQVAGCLTGITGGGGGAYLKLIGVTMQNEFDVDQITVTAENLFQDDTFLPLAGKPHKYIRVWGGANMDVVWNGTGPFPNFGNSPYWGPMTGSRVVIKNWQGTGKDYLLFYNSQLGSRLSWHSDPGGYNISNPPIKGLTMQQAWETLGMGYEGDMVKDSEALTLDGIIDGYARAGLGVSLGPPRAVVTFPTMREVARIENNLVKIYALPTGDPSNASDFLMVSLDGAPAIKATNGGSASNPVVAYSTHISPGVHTVKAWRTYKNKPTVAIQDSEFTSQYCIGTCAGVPRGHFSFSSNPVEFSGVVNGSRPNSQVLTVTNTGGAAFNAGLVSNQPWCHTNPVNLLVVAGDSRPVTVYVDNPSNLGNSSCSVVFNDPTTDNSGAAITVDYVVRPGGL